MDYYFWEENTDHAILMLVEGGVLGRVPHGYCWYCNTETEVYEILDLDRPAQPAQCHDCLKRRSVDFIAQDERAMARWT